jgi:ABC-2 type transport system ATP-binding protein
MSAASYIGRVGGLAVALGIGTAIVTGQGVANATTDGENAAAGDDQGTTTTADKAPDSGDPGKIEVKLPRLSDVIGRHRADDTTPTSTTATSIVKRLSDATKQVTDALENAAGAVDRDGTAVRTTSRTGGSSSLSDRLAARAATRTPAPGAAAAAAQEGAIQSNNVVANQFVNQVAAAKDWIASSRIAAGRAEVDTPTVPQPSPLWTPPRILAPLGTMKAAPSTSSPVATSTLLTTVLNFVNPLAATGNGPAAPGVGSPLSLVLAGAARREVGIDSFAALPLLAPSSDSLTYDPTVVLTNGVITGNNVPSSGVNYLVVSQPDGGGKVYVNPLTGSFTFLPDLSTVQMTGPAGTETFRVVAVETTPFTTALTGIPLVGGLVNQVLIVLYQVPVVNELLSPIIGKSKITDVSITVDDFAAGTQPVAFTVKIPSPKDGALISTNYFPAYAVAADPTGNTTAPTILNGPGLATAGNIDPTAPDTVDGLVPGLNFMRAAGYNVVTWDPRGEFDSGGILQLDSPAYEGQDVMGIIDWLSNNIDYSHQQFDPQAGNPGAANDPAIGMVGGSYGGGIQLVTAGIDPRVDVIVPGIAWNSLLDSLYTNDAFKTSYSSLLLLSLVTTGAQINPQIYSGILTGAVLGILTPAQQALLSASGPDFLTKNINIPVLFIQGTVDVLFPLAQAVTNAATLGPDAQVKMIWYCGGHGVCLTMDATQLAQQEIFLRNNTIAMLDYGIHGTANPNPTFQFVDQNGQWFAANMLPIDDPDPTHDDFYSGNTPVVTNGSGGLLAIIPIIGGSGPQSQAGFPQSLGLGSQASNAINVPLNDGTLGTTVVGAPQLTMTYSGIGTSRHVYAQIVDKETGEVVGNIVTPIPVTLDGTTRVATIPMEDIVYTYDGAVPDGADLELQIVGSATPYLNLTEYGFINVSDVSVSLPTPGTDVTVTKEFLPPLAV